MTNKTLNLKSKNGSKVSSILGNDGPIIKIIDMEALQKFGVAGAPEVISTHLICVQLCKSDLNTIDVIRIGHGNIMAKSENNKEIEAFGIVYPTNPKIVVIANNAQLKMDGNATLINPDGIAHYTNDDYSGPVTSFYGNGIELVIAFKNDIDLSEIKSMEISGIKLN